MPKVVKLFRYPEEAAEAVAQLKKKGYGADKVGVLLSERSKEVLAAAALPEASGASLPEAGSVVALGMASAVAEKAKAELRAALGEGWGLDEETLDYLQFGILQGGAVVGVDADEAKAKEVKALLRAASRRMEREPMWAGSPGFTAASRMSETNPVDAPMSGDFRKY